MKRSHAEAVQDSSAFGSVQYQSDLQPYSAQQQSALETLAEVSGQHSPRRPACSDLYAGTAQSQDPASAVVEAIAEQALLAQLQSHGDPTDNDPTYRMAMSNAPTAQIAIANGEIDQRHTSNLDRNLARASPPSLTKTVSGTSQQSMQRQTNVPDVDPAYGTENQQDLQSFNLPIDMGLSLGEPTIPPELPWAEPTAVSSMQSFGSLTMPHTDLVSGYGILSANARQRPRGRFDDVRRKEVSNIRKQGACLRCRMLKKPCSGETPCKTCSSVESARIWRGKCVRTRLADELTLWSTGLFTTRAESQAKADLVDSEDTDVSSHVTVGCREDLLEPINIPIRKMRRRETSDVKDMSFATWRLVSADLTDGTLDKLAQKHFAEIIEDQLTAIRQILKRTRGLSVHTTAGKQPDNKGDGQQGQKRSSYGSQVDLSKDIVELWTLSELLTSSQEDASLKLRFLDGVSLDTPSQRLIQMQLQAAIETHCSKLSRSVLNELERRLLQRQQTSRLGTLLSALVLLSCVERMTAYYRNLEDAPTNIDQQHGASATIPSEPGDTGLATPSQPLKTPVAMTWTQGESFTDLLTSLLRMRALPPKTKISPDGTLESLRNFAMPVQHINGNTTNKSDDEQKEAAADWLDSLKLQAEPLKATRDAPPPGPGDGPEAWSLRYIARVLLPDNWR